MKRSSGQHAERTDAATSERKLFNDKAANKFSDLFSGSLFSDFSTHLIVQEDKIHLDEYERHPGGGRERQQHIMALGVPLELEVLAELQARINHAADAESFLVLRQQKNLISRGYGSNSSG
jgi:hypothetical protein